MLFHEVISRIMKKQGVRQVDLCNACDTSSAYISMLLSGKMKDPRLSMCASIAHALGYSLDEIVELMKNDCEGL